MEEWEEEKMRRGERERERKALITHQRGNNDYFIFDLFTQSVYYILNVNVKRAAVRNLFDRNSARVLLIAFLRRFECL